MVWTKYMSPDSKLVLESINNDKINGILVIFDISLIESFAIINKSLSMGSLLKKTSWVLFVNEDSNVLQIESSVKIYPLMKIFMIGRYMKIIKGVIFEEYGIRSLYQDYPTDTIQSKYLGRWKKQTGFIPNRPFLTCCSEIRGYEVTIVYLEIRPYIIVNKKPNSTEVELSGIIGDVLNNILGHFGIKVKRIFQEQSKKFGDYRQNNTATGLFKTIQEKKADIVASGLLMTEGRKKIADYSMPITETAISALYRINKNKNYTYISFRGFTILSRMFITLICLIFALVLIQIGRFKNLEDLRDVDLLTIFGELMYQGFDVKSERNGIRTIHWIFLIIGVMLTTLYGSYLTSESIFNKEYRPFATFWELALSKEYKPLLWEDSAQLTIIKNSKHPEYRALWNAIKYKLGKYTVSSSAEMDRKLMKGNVAVILSKSSLENIMKRLNNDGTFRIMDGSYMKGGVYFALQKNSPLTDIFNEQILKLRESGIIDRLNAKYDPDKSSNNSEKTVSFRATEVNQMYVAFLAAFITPVISIFMSIIENMYFNKNISCILNLKDANA